MIKKKEEGFWTRKNIMSLIIVFLMISSVLAIWQGTQSSSDTIEPYNDHDITFTDEGFFIESDYGDIHGYNYPSSLEALSFDSALVSYLGSSSQVVVLFDPEDSALEYIEILRSNLAVDDFPAFGQEASFAITTNSSQYSYPVLDCASTPLPTLFIHTANVTSPRIYQEEGCVVLEAARGDDLFKLKDRIVYTLADVMDAS